MSNLELDPNVIHPFVRIHIVYIKTGTYIKKSRKDRNCLSHYETITIFDDINKEYNAAECDFIIPFSTSCVDLREEGGAKVRWNESK